MGRVRCNRNVSGGGCRPLVAGKILSEVMRKYCAKGQLPGIKVISDGASKVGRAPTTFFLVNVAKV